MEKPKKESTAPPGKLGFEPFDLEEWQKRMKSRGVRQATGVVNWDEVPMPFENVYWRPGDD